MIEKSEDGTTRLAEAVDIATNYSMRQLCEMCQVSTATVQEYIEYNVIVPQSSDELVFQQFHLDRLRKAVRLHQDLELNSAGVALALDLLDTIDQLKNEMARLRLHKGHQ